MYSMPIKNELELMPLWPSCSAGTPALRVTPTNPCQSHLLIRMLQYLGRMVTHKVGKAYTSRHGQWKKCDCSRRVHAWCKGPYQDIDDGKDDDGVISAKV